ncbi:alpha-tocopherol transfer protein-like [Tropilaelaps mercedesae]|uniref:Alpha-tocopherol transfer protein-like n=1 Tax=Tropilaelaps mercedesae TaxID=418985 RepID=A0A1V9XY39_9ACAR|nr:alpha-tocopherol transfer protein-like [Tropilaelaps mercedesae]
MYPDTLTTPVESCLAVAPNDVIKMSDKILTGSALEVFDILRVREEAGFAKRAEQELGETPEIRARALQQLAEKLRTQNEFRPRMEEDYLIRFLRAKKFDVERAFSLMRNFYRCRLISPSKFLPIGIGPKDVKHLYDLRMGLILPKRNPLDGSVVLIAQFGDWTPESGYDLLDAYTPTALAFDYIQRNPECQLYGFRYVFNLKGLEWRYLRFLYPAVMRALVSCWQNGYPARFKGAHIVNNSRLWNVVWEITKPFLNEKVQKRVHLHASDMKSLHEFIPPEILPEEYGGKAGVITHHWLVNEMYLVHDEFVENSYYGYGVKPDGSELEEEELYHRNEIHESSDTNSN